MVWGGGIDGGKIFGSFPNIAEGSSDNAGPSGRMIPTTSIDKFFEEMAQWFGVEGSDMDSVLPNIANFSTDPTIGFIKQT